MIDTSALVAALISDHEHHQLARAHLSAELRIPVIVMAETFSQLRRTFGQSTRTAAQLLEPWTSPERLIATTTTATATATVLRRSVELDLGGNIHDALIAQVVVEAGVPLVTLDGRQHRIALALGVDSRYLLAEQAPETAGRRVHLAEGVGFEPTEGCPSHAFQACRFGRSRTPPGGQHASGRSASGVRAGVSGR
jgi:predicted nucleic acid-binding protein